MSDEPLPSPLSQDIQPRLVSTPNTYSRTAAGPVQRAELRSPDGELLGHVWTDGNKAAGFLAAQTAEGVRAGAEVWAILRDAYGKSTPAADVLNPELYVAVGELGEPTTDPDA